MTLWRCTDEPSDLGADARGRADPIGIVPAADEPLAPFAGDHLLQARDGGVRERTEGVAIEVGDALGEGEARAEGGERVGRVEGGGVRERGEG